MKKLTSGLLALALALTLTDAAQGEPKHRHHANKAQRTATVDRNSFAVANSHVIRVRHPRAWWVARFPNTRFVLFGGGYYYWWNGYWYPAYGYSPYYSTYLYDGPIYGYNNYAPGQVTENVQMALRTQGYYHGAIDGLIGPQTRSALAQYQRSNGLVVTAAIDQPTLVTLGLA
jgi:Putative peptidoglycan binding domain